MCSIPSHALYRSKKKSLITWWPLKKDGQAGFPSGQSNSCKTAAINLGGSMSDIPYDILLNIFPRISVRSFFQFRCVCKTWRDLLSDSYFIELQLNRSVETNISNPDLILNCGPNLYHVLYSDYNDTWDDHPVKLEIPFKLSNIGIVGSCNGLVCLLGFTRRCLDVIVWNPFTRDFNKLPFTPKRYPDSRFPLMSFGYSPSKNVYKVIRISFFPTNCSSLVEVHTLGSDSWRRIGEIPYGLVGYCPSGTFINGALHWILSSGQEAEPIVCCDVGDESFREFPSPCFEDNESFNKLEVLGGLLSVVCTYSYDSLVKIWMMKDYGVKESWSKQFSISLPIIPQGVGHHKYLKPLGFTKNGEIFLQNHDKKLVLYDPERKTFRSIQIQGVPSWSEVGTFIGTLISPNTCN